MLGSLGRDMDGHVPSSTGSAFLAELRLFLDFLKSLWGLLAGVTVLFPLSNVLLEVLPLGSYDEGGSLTSVTPAAVSTVTTMLCVFVTLWTFGQRLEMSRRGRSQVHRGAWMALGTALGALIVYWVMHHLIVGGFYYDVLGWETDDLRLIGGDVFLATLYVLAFTLLTRSFLTLALAEYLDLR